MQLSSVQTLLSSQGKAPVPLQAPKSQVSPVVHTSPSSQPMPAAVPGECWQPAVLSQTSSLHGSLSSQALGVPVQVPP